MSNDLIWQQNSNVILVTADNLAAIALWWSELTGKGSCVATEISYLPIWDSRRISIGNRRSLTKSLILAAPAGAEGITLYWRNQGYGRA